jgi:membrane associated rhomboid family serine protease
MIPLKDDAPSMLKPYVTVSLIATCCAVFLWQRTLDSDAGRQVVECVAPS